MPFDHCFEFLEDGFLIIACISFCSENNFARFIINKLSDSDADYLSELSEDAGTFMIKIFFCLMFFASEKTCLSRPLGFKSLVELCIVANVGWSR